MIPKIIHQVWIGPNKIPDHCKVFSKNMQRMNQGWKYILWDNLQSFQGPFKNDPVISKWKELLGKHIAAPTMIAERIRFLALYEYGGIYADIDAAPIRPFDYLMKEVNPETEFFGGVKERQDPGASELIMDCAFIGSSPKSLASKLCLEILERHIEDIRPSYCILFSHELLELQNKAPSKIQSFDKEYFYDNKKTSKTIVLHDINHTRLWSWRNGKPIL
jgi:hypothetical protein